MKGYERENEEYRLQRVHEVCFNDLTNKKFGKLTVLGIDHKKGKIYFWKCKCECGNECVVVGSALSSGHTISCGCAKKKSQLIDLTGKVFGRLTVIGYDHQEGSKHFWKCKCDCGSDNIIVDGKNLRSGRKKSCGCLRVERCKSKKPKEDLTGRVFGDLIVDSYVKHSYWLCKCKCGGERIVHSLFLNNGSVFKCKDCSDNKHGYSNIEKEIAKAIKSMTKCLVVENDRHALGTLEIDIYIPKLKIGIEYCGSGFHASENGIYKNLPKNYHQNKFLLAKQKGIHLITIFDKDYEQNKEGIMSYIKSILDNTVIHNKPNTEVVYTDNDYDDGRWLLEYGYNYDGQDDIPYFIYDRFKVYRSGISRWKVQKDANIELTK